SVTGGVVSGDLVASGDKKNATFTGNLAGSAVIHASLASHTSTDSGTLTVTAGSPAVVRVENAADGTGAVVPAQNISSGSSLTVYAIRRDSAGNFVDNVAATAWSLPVKT